MRIDDVRAEPRTFRTPEPSLHYQNRLREMAHAFNHESNLFDYGTELLRVMQCSQGRMNRSLQTTRISSET